jgi:hypothetical protein
MAKLDKGKDFCEVYGGGKVRFEQDGKLFDYKGKEIVDGTDLVNSDDSDGFPDPPVNKKATAGSSDVDDQLAQQGL